MNLPRHSAVIRVFGLESKLREMASFMWEMQGAWPAPAAIRFAMRVSDAPGRITALLVDSGHHLYRFVAEP